MRMKQNSVLSPGVHFFYPNFDVFNKLPLPSFIIVELLLVASVGEGHQTIFYHLENVPNMIKIA